MLVVVAAVISFGPGTLIEFVSGLFFVRPRAASISVPTRHTDAELQSQLASVASGLPRGRMSVVAVDLKTGASGAVDAERGYAAASLFKLPILVTLLAEEDAGRVDASRQVTIRQEDWTDGSGVLQARIGDSFAISELTRLMIQDSDNIAALALLDVLGVARVNDTSGLLGLTGTHVVDHRAGEDGDHTSSAADMANLFVSLTAGQAVSQRVSEQALSYLELKQSNTWLGDNLPFWVKVAHKWGDLPEARNDVGVVYTPRGSYVIAVLTESAPPEASASAIARASRVVYDYLGNR